MMIVEDLQILKKIIDNSLNKIAKETRLTANEIRILLFLYENEKLDLASEIVEKLMISKSHVSVSVESLENKKYIEKIQDTKDKKKIHLKLTISTKPILELLDIEIDKMKKVLFKNVSKEDTEAFMSTLKKIIRNTKEFTYDL